MNYCRNCGASLAPSEPHEAAPRPRGTPAAAPIAGRALGHSRGRPPTNPGLAVRAGGAGGEPGQQQASAAQAAAPADNAALGLAGNWAGTLADTVADQDRHRGDGAASDPLADNALNAPKRTCPHCSGSTPAGFGFCQQCGNPLPTVSEAVRTGAVISGETGGDDEGPEGSATADVAGKFSQPEVQRGRTGKIFQVTRVLPPPEPVQEPTWGTLIAVNPDGSEGARHALAGAWIDIGRSQADICFEDDQFLAPRHARFERGERSLTVVPIDNLNGVYLRVDVPRVVGDGDVLLLGREVLRFEIVAEEERIARPLIRHGVALFGSPPREPWGRLCQLLASGGIRDVRHLWEPVVTVGREEGDLVFRDDAFLSRRHATFSWLDSQCVVRDLGSSNGTFLRLSEKTEVPSGAHLRVGDQLFLVQIDSLP